MAIALNSATAWQSANTKRQVQRKRTRRNYGYVLLVVIPKTHDRHLAKRLAYLAQYRIQRRNAYRVPVPVHDEVTCDVVFSDQLGKPITRRLRVFDLSIGGLTLLMPLDIPELPTDTALSVCTLRLPDTEPMNVQLIVRNSFALPTRNDNIRRRVGCEFAELPGSAENRLQRYIFEIERKLRSKSKL